MAFHFVSSGGEGHRPSCRHLLGSLHPLKHEDHKGHKGHKVRKAKDNEGKQKPTPCLPLCPLCPLWSLCLNKRETSAPPTSYGGAAPIAHQRRNFSRRTRAGSERVVPISLGRTGRRCAADAP